MTRRARTVELIVLIEGSEAGIVRSDARGHLQLTYDPRWRESADALPLSLSMPLAGSEHGHDVVEAFLWGLLPDNGLILQQWGRQFQASPRNPFALLAHVGEDCAGAVQLVRPERLDAVLSDEPARVAWLSEAEVAERLRALREDQAAWRAPHDEGRFSLAGSQPKTALLLRDGRFGVPTGRTPTTHVLKPPLPGFDGHVENEHLCLVLARALGIPAAHSEVRRFEDELAIVVTRYDRVETSARAETAQAAGDFEKAAALRRMARAQPVLRVHQEDACQALGMLPGRKYQAEGGPAPRDVAALLAEHSSRPRDDIATFVDALAFNWLAGGTDAHAKNYSLLHGRGGRVRLAPLYDLASALPYAGVDHRRIKMAMKIGSKYRLVDVGRQDWEKLAHELALGVPETLARIGALAERLPDVIADAAVDMRRDGLDHPIVTRLVDVLVERARTCRGVIGGDVS